MSKPESPLGPTHLASINNGLDAIAVAEKQVILAKQAGIDVGNEEQNLRDTKAKLLQIKNTYFPNS